MTETRTRMAPLSTDDLGQLHGLRKRRPARQLRLPPPSAGQRVADLVAVTVGSWRFIVLQSIAIAAWLIGNTYVGPSAWDPYPFILLNLLLSFQAAYTAPVIMMSQNRQSARDRIDARSDYEVNLRAEMQIMALHAKLDATREQEWARIAEHMQLQGERLRRIEERLEARM